jgi:hypothetical protein
MMPRQEPVRVPMDEIRRLVEDLDGRRIQDGRRQTPGRSYSIASSSRAHQGTHRPRQETVRVPLDEVRRTVDHLDRRRAQERTRRRQGESQRAGVREGGVCGVADDIGACGGWASCSAETGVCL